MCIQLVNTMYPTWPERTITLITGSLYDVGRCSISDERSLPGLQVMSFLLLCLRRFLTLIGPSILSILNNSLSSGVVPASFKHAVIQPLLKKNGLDPFNMSNFRPISKLSFISKVLEKNVLGQLNDLLKRNNIFDRFQSGFRAGHSTAPRAEQSILRVSNDIFRGVESGSRVDLLLLDLTAAFDTVDHDILVACLKNHISFQGLALNWFSSYLEDRTFSVSLGDYSSSTAPLVCGAPQGSIMGPI